MKQNAKLKTFILAAFFSIPFLAIAEEPDFEINMRIVKNGVELSTPSMLVKEGSEASISLSGENPVALRLVVSSSDENEVHSQSKLSKRSTAAGSRRSSNCLES